MCVARKSVLEARQERSVAVPESPPWRHPGSSLVQSVTLGEFPQNGLYASIRKHVVVFVFTNRGMGSICEFCGEGGLRPPVRQLLGPLSLAS